MGKNKKQPFQTHLRIDFKQEIIKSEKKPDGSMVVEVALIPDPNRYESILENGKLISYKDKNTGLIIPVKVLENAVTKMKGLPIYYSPPKEQDFCQYLRQRKQEIIKNWDNEIKPFVPTRPIDSYLISLLGKEAEFVILYVDMANSTTLSSKIDRENYSKINKLFLLQMAKVIDNFNGYVLKMSGDCVIGIFPADTNYTGKTDNAIQASMVMRKLLINVISPICQSKKLPDIGCHIGCDIGRVKVESIGAKDIGGFIDLLGYSMNLTAKIQSHAGFNEILIGRKMFEILHWSWQKYTERIDLGDDWDLTDPDNEKKYELYRFVGNFECSKD